MVGILRVAYAEILDTKENKRLKLTDMYHVSWHIQYIPLKKKLDLKELRAAINRIPWQEEQMRKTYSKMGRSSQGKKDTKK